LSGFFFDGINLQRGGRSVTKAIEFAATIDANEAKARLAFSDVAVAWTKVAVRAAVRVALPPLRFVQY